MGTSPTSRPGRDERLRPYRVAAVVLLVLAALCVLVELQSPSKIYWTGDRVPGTNDGGIVFYEVGGEQRTLNDPREAPASPAPVAVYTDADDSSRDRLGGPGRWVDLIFVLTPFVGAGTVIIVGVVRTRRFRRRRASAGAP